MATPDDIRFTTLVTERARWYSNAVLLPNARTLDGAALGERTATALLLPFLVHIKRLLMDDVRHAEFMERFREYVANVQECLLLCRHVHKATDVTVVSEDCARALLVVLVNIIHAPRDIEFRSKDLFD